MKRTIRKGLALVLACVMLVGMMPISAMAAEIEAIPRSAADNPSINLGDTKVTISNGGDIAYFSFTPQEDGTCTFQAFNGGDTLGYLYDSDMNLLAYDDDSGYEGAFKLTYDVKANTTYILGAGYYDTEYTGTFTVKLELKTYSGVCGENLIWNLSDDGTLTISGEGAMTDYAAGTAPWEESRDDITALEIGDGVTSIGAYAFSNLDNLTSITIDGNVTEIRNQAFYDCNSLVDVIIAGDVTTIAEKAFYWCDKLVNLVIGEKVVAIEDSAFADCTSLTNVTLGGNVTTIGRRAFTYAASLNSLVIPASVETIASQAFRYCTDLTDITFEGNAPVLRAMHLIMLYPQPAIPPMMTAGLRMCCRIMAVRLPGFLSAVAAIHTPLLLLIPLAAIPVTPPTPATCAAIAMWMTMLMPTATATKAAFARFAVQTIRMIAVLLTLAPVVRI